MQATHAHYACTCHTRAHTHTHTHTHTHARARARRCRSIFSQPQSHFFVMRMDKDSIRQSSVCNVLSSYSWSPAVYTYRLSNCQVLCFHFPFPTYPSWWTNSWVLHVCFLCLVFRAARPPDIAREHAKIVAQWLTRRKTVSRFVCWTFFSFAACHEVNLHLLVPDVAANYF